MNTYLDQALDSLKLINQAHINSIPIHEYYLRGRFSLWSCIQAKILPLIIARTTTASAKPSCRQQDNLFKLWFLKLFILIESFLAFLWYLIRRPEILVYSPDIVVGLRRCDARIGQVYNFLKEEEITYGEIIHVPLGRSLLVNFLKRRRPVIYLEFFNVLLSLAQVFKYRLAFKMVEPKSVIFPKEKTTDQLAAIVSDLSRHMPSIDFSVKTLSKFIYLIGISRLVMIDDSRHWGLLMIAAHDAKVQTIAVQHGRFNEYLPGYRNISLPPQRCPIPDKYIVWNDFWKNRLIQLSETFEASPDHLIVGGRPREQVKHSLKNVKADDGITTIVIPLEPHTPFSSIQNYVEAFLRCPSVEVVCKIRPDVPPEKQLLTIPISLRQNPKFKMKTQLNDITDKIDVIAGTYSTFLYEMAEAGIPVIVLSTPETQAYDLVQAGFAEIVSSPQEVPKILKSIAKRSPEIMKRQKKTLAVTASIKETLRKIFENEKPTS